MKKLLVLILSCVLLSGCVFLKPFTRRVADLPYDCYRKDVIEQFGKPNEEVHLGDNIIRLTYEKGNKRYWLYFRGYKLFKKTDDEKNIYQDIEDLYDLDLISRAEMEQQWEVRRANAMQMLQMFTLRSMQNRAYHPQTQQQQQQQPTTTSGTLPPNYDLYEGGYHKGQAIPDGSGGYRIYKDGHLQGTIRKR